MNNSSGKVLIGLMLGGTLISLGYYLSNNKQLTNQISTKVMGSLNTLSDNSHELMNKVEHSLHTLSAATPEMQGELTSKVEKRLNTLLDNSQEIQKQLTDLVGETKNSLKHVQKDREINKQFIDIVSRLTPVLVSMPIRRRLRELKLVGTIIGLGYYLYTNKQLTKKISNKLKDVLKSYGIQDKVMHVVNDTKHSLNDTVKNVESSLGESLDKTCKQLSNTVSRLNAAFYAGRDAAKESLNNTKSNIDKTNSSHVKDSVEKPLGVTEKTFIDKTGNLYSESKNIAKSLRDAEANFDRIISSKPENDHHDSDKFIQI